MKYLFFDIECADGGKATICSFGYVIADMNFNIIEKKDIIINPEAEFCVTGRKNRPDVGFAYPEEYFLQAQNFAHFHEEIKNLVENEEFYIVGHSIFNDVRFLKKTCKKYKLKQFTYKFFDTQRMYSELFEDRKQISLENALISLGVFDEFESHKSDEDARATMLLLKALLEKANMSFEEYKNSTNHCSGKVENGRYSWDYTPPKKIEQARREKNGLTKDNIICRGKENWIIFIRYLDYGHSVGEKSNKLIGKKVTVSKNYEVEHFKEMINLVGMIKAAGGEYVLKASESDIFVTFDTVDEEGNLRYCSRYDHVKKEIEKGKNIEIVTLDDLLKILGTNIEALEEMPLVNVEYLLDDKYSKNNQVREICYSKRKETANLCGKINGIYRFL